MAELAQRLGPYQLLRKLGHGGMAEVFLAERDGRRVVVKRVLPHLADDPKLLAMFVNEARLASQLRHPNVVELNDLGEDHGIFYLAMEFVDGPSLRGILRAAQRRGDRLGQELVAALGAQIASGLHHAHEARGPDGRPLGVVHRDVSPDNVLLDFSGRARIVDFGIARAANQERHTEEGMVRGKLAYMAPEYLLEGEIGRALDVYALGVVLWELLAGRQPFEAAREIATAAAILAGPAPSISSVRSDVDPRLSHILERAMDPDPRRRLGSCAELQQELERFLRERGARMGVSELAALARSATPDAPTDEAAPPSGSKPAGASSSPRDPTAPLGAFTRPSRPLPDELTEGAAPAPRSSRPLALALVGLGTLASMLGLAWFAHVQPTSRDAGSDEPRDSGSPVTPPPPVAPPIDAGPLDAGPPDAGLAAPQPTSRRSGTVEFFVSPYADVEIDRVLRGQSPGISAQRLSVGRHAVRLLRDGAVVWQGSIEVMPGRNPPFRKVLR